MNFDEWWRLYSQYEQRVSALVSRGELTLAHELVREWSDWITKNS